MISKAKKFRNKASGIGLAVLLAITSIVQNPQLVVHAQDVSNTEKEEKTIEAQVIVTKYENLWQNKSNPDAIPPIYVTAGIPVIWYVDVPEDIAVKGCRSTLKIPDIGWGTDTRNREEGHLQLTNGRNLIQRPDANEGDVVLFTPKETGDIIFTCWMGSGCHRNYIRVVENAYQYTDTVTATAIAVTNTPKVEATQTPVTVSPTAITTSAIVASNTPATVSPTSIEATATSNVIAPSFVPATTAPSGSGGGSISIPDTTNAQVIITKYSDLWQSKDADDFSSPIYVTAGIPVIWYVDVPEDVKVKGCGSTIKIPGIGWGTDSYNKEEGHLQLTNGRNLIQRPNAKAGDLILFTPTEKTDILFTCWMGSGCHKNYIRVVANTQTPAPTKTPSATQTGIGSQTSGISQTPGTSGQSQTSNSGYSAGTSGQSQSSGTSQNQTSGATATQVPTVVPTIAPVTTVTPSAVLATQVPSGTAIQETDSVASQSAIVPDSQLTTEDVPSLPSTDNNEKTPVLKNTYSKLKAGAIAKIIVENAGTETIKFKSLNKKIATVNADGTVTALKKGTATIQVTVGAITLTYKVKVTSNPFLSKKVVTVKKGKTATITVNGKAANTSLQYAKSKLVKISTNKKQTSLKIKGLKTGTTKLKIKINGVVVTLKITVKK
ncbi:MAG: Ig-like domain-containing protein [Lachnospiraceae bacterium]|nr:Ig-like domain-containing protein [Lachnospiraceae bacterium]